MQILIDFITQNISENIIIIGSISDIDSLEYKVWNSKFSIFLCREDEEFALVAPILTSWTGKNLNNSTVAIFLNEEHFRKLHHRFQQSFTISLKLI